MAIADRGQLIGYLKMVNEVEPAEEAEATTGRPPHQPTPESIAKVESLASYGVPERSIARLIGLGSKNTLRKYYVETLELGNAKFQAMLGQTAARVALGGPTEYFPAGHPNAGKIAKAEVQPNTTMLIFFLKTRLGLQERVNVDLNDRRPDDGNEFNTVGLTQAERTMRVLALLKTAEMRMLAKGKKQPGAPPAKAGGEDDGKGQKLH